jgi:hypothetical protein
MILPFVVLTILSIAGFLLPPYSNERITFQVTILLAVTVFLLLIHDTLPPSSEFFPKIGIYFTITLLLTGMSCLMSAVLLNLSLRGSCRCYMKIPNCMRKSGNHQESIRKDTPEDSQQGSPQETENPNHEQHLRDWQIDGGELKLQLGLSKAMNTNTGNNEKTAGLKLFAYRLDWLFFAFYTLATIINTLAFLVVFSQAYEL